jgi:hypothetical protein
MIRTLAVVSALALAAAAVPAEAQLPFRLGVQAGASIPTGDMADGAKTGYHVGLLAEAKPMLLPVGVRGDIIYNEFGLEDDELGDIDVDFRLLNVNANAILELPGVGLRPYLLGGLGWYQGWFVSDDDDTDKESAVGFNVGGGIRFGLSGFGAAVEAHYRTVNLDFDGVGELETRFIPISFVLTF